MAKAKKSPAKKSKAVKKSAISKQVLSDDTSKILAATALLFSGSCVILIGNIQSDESLQLLIIGFGAAMLVFGSVILGMAISKIKR